jgi:hypothetical protein
MKPRDGTKVGGSANAERMWRVKIFIAKKNLTPQPPSLKGRGRKSRASMSNLPIRRVVLYKHGVGYLPF